MSLVNIQQAAQPLWQIALAALGGALIGGIFAMLGGWWERRDASKARREDRAARCAADYADRQRQVAEQLMRDLITLVDAIAELEATASSWIRVQESGAGPQLLKEALEEYGEAFRAKELSAHGASIGGLAKPLPTVTDEVRWCCLRAGLDPRKALICRMLRCLWLGVEERHPHGYAGQA